MQARGIVEQVSAQAEKLIDELDELRRQKDSADFSERAAAAKVAFKANLRKLQDLADPVTRKNVENYVPDRPDQARRHRAPSRAREGGHRPLRA